MFSAFGTESAGGHNAFDPCRINKKRVKRRGRTYESICCSVDCGAVRFV
jgi:hypothetical protein